ncbi:MAG: adenosylcobinamide-GDP ribazoletransferase [Gloeomargarita sp. SKYBB_i_bin120]|nr:adenosylcobinamide-GDP ribazoletransferase [Gloeomargarita sp. SKYG98]MCS7291630.1 adenosylcobinamide-GDP ribazoletransferase [Gloeomargarita sp. SKYB120]MDW8177189.1 adenosylcobinamide-GDP ribazoletransferase [Gloeomargarita sp. SKYBB_i_bin120]
MGRWWRQFWGAVAFYSILPVPKNAEVQQVAVWAPLVGVVLGSLLALVDQLLAPMPLLPRSGLLVALQVGLTGGLHLDGVMDTADGLAVSDPQRRLEVMRDSRAGAYGVMAGCLVLVLKILALGHLPTERFWLLTGAMGWSRWGQVVAIGLYPYLRTEGKGALHHQQRQPGQWWPGLGFLVAWAGLWSLLRGDGRFPLVFTSWGLLLALAVGFVLYRQLGGHTGDTYGAVVEWVETLCWCAMTALLPNQALS